MDNFSTEDFKNILREKGFTDEEIKKNWEKYFEAALVITVDDYLSKIPETERKEIIGNDNVDDNDGIKRIIERFSTHYESNKVNFDPPLNELNFISKIKEYIIE